jgi:hypothetical protein
MKRCDRKWFEDHDVAMLDKNGTPTRVEIVNLRGDYEGEALYTVREMEGQRQQYPASEKNLSRIPRVAR